MRVLDSVERLVNNEVLADKMGGKKKQKQQSTPSGSNSRKTSVTSPVVNGEKPEGCENPSSVQCRHLKSVNKAQVRKKLKDCRSFHCEECQKDKDSKTEAKEVVGKDEEEEGDIFCCLSCGHLGCGRFSEKKHALQHFDVRRSGPHTIVLNIRTLALWCYECDNEVAPTALAALKEIAEFVGQQVKAASQAITNGEKSAVVEESKGKSQVKTRASTRASTMPVEIKGLSNLGNTCFFNAVMQNMAQTHVLQILLNDVQAFRKGAVFSITPTGKDDNECGGPLPTLQFTIERDPESLSMSFQSFLSEFRQNSKSTILNPGTLFGQVCKKAPRFRGFQQQDSHELLRYMLDALKMEETRRLRAAVVRHFGLDPDNVAKEIGNDVKLKAKMKQYDVVNMSFVEQIFGGQLLQVIECLQCNQHSKRHEPFLDLSLPIVEPKDAKKTVVKKDKDDDLKALERNDKNFKPSKYQQKKAKAKTRKQAKHAKRRESTTEEAQKDDQAPEESNETETTSDGADVAQLTNTLASKLTLDGSCESETDKANGTNTVSEKASSNLATAADCNGDNGLKSSESEDDEQEEETPKEEDQMSKRDEVDVSDSIVEPLNPDETATDRQDTLASCLRQFTAYELLNGKNKFGCANCAKVDSGAKNNSDASHLANGNGVAEETKRNRKDSNAFMYTDARKRYLIYSPPAVLTLHLKRFHQVGSRMQKISKHVEFPLILDISPFCCKHGNRYNSAQKRVLYSLYGIVCHSGSLSGGHYIAYVKVRPKDEKLATAFLPNHNPVPADSRNGLNEHDGQLENGEPFGNGRVEPTPAQGKWYYVSDTQVSEVAESRVLAAEAYLLFYERIF